MQAVENALGAGSDRFTQEDIKRVTATQQALRLKPAEVQVLHHGSVHALIID